VYLDLGQGLQYNGLYTAIELPEDTMIEDQLGESAGNIYKPESALGRFVESEFYRQNNEASRDYSDVQALITALNDSTLRASNRAQWRANLEAAFDVNGFLKFLAVNNVIASWDQYGFLAHNYYLYAHSTRKLIWIPWDQNNSFGAEPGITAPVPRTNQALSFTMNEVDASWPLLRHVADDPVYFERYRAEVRNFCNGAFAPSNLDALVDKYMDLIAPYVVGPNGEQPKRTLLGSPDEFVADRPFLKTYSARRRTVAEQFAR
jgi:spore coat protein H